MALKQVLSQIRQGSPGCHLAAYVDLKAKLVLGIDAEKSPKQETLNELAEAAHAALAGQDATKLASQLGEGHKMQIAMMIDARDATLYLGGAAPSNDAICCIGRPTMDLVKLVESARNSMATLYDSAS